MCGCDGCHQRFDKRRDSSARCEGGDVLHASKVLMNANYAKMSWGVHLQAQSIEGCFTSKSLFLEKDQHARSNAFHALNAQVQSLKP